MLFVRCRYWYRTVCHKVANKRTRERFFFCCIMKRSLSSTDLSSMASDLSVSIERTTDCKRITNVEGCTSSRNETSNLRSLPSSTSDNTESSVKKKRCQVVTPELLPSIATFPEISPLDPFDMLPPSVDLPFSRQRRTQAIQFDSNLFDTGPATAALNAMGLLALSRPFEARLNISNKNLT